MDRSTRRFTILAYVLVALVTAAVTAAITGLLTNVFQRKQEAAVTSLRMVEVGEDVVDPAEWGKNWPRQYDGYRRTSEATNTKYGGSVVGPEGALAEQKLARDPWIIRLFAGYLFSVDYRDRRGHAFMLRDQEVTKRNVPAEGKQSGNCLHCHASIMPLYRKLGGEALPQGSEAEKLQKGLELVGAMGYWDAHKQLSQTTNGAHPVSCVDCHDPSSMELRVTRPAFITGIQKLASSDAPVPHLPSIESWRRGARDRLYDPNEDGTRQEMRSYVCGQCHVEYYCGKGMTIFFPWDRGMTVEQIESSYNDIMVKGQRFKDWVHAETSVEVLKAQHPEFEVWSQGVHARSGVACSDCHMPYKREGALKVSDHWVRSPLLNVNRACETCHPYGEQELTERVQGIQDRHHALLQRSAQAAIAMLDAIKSLRRNHDGRHRQQVEAQVRETLAGDQEFSALAQAEQEQRLTEETANRLTSLWREALAENGEFRDLGELHRAALWRLDFVSSENSMGFHAAQEMARILAEAIDLSRQAQALALARLGGVPLAAATQESTATTAEAAPEAAATTTEAAAPSSAAVTP
jgi:nitrite reductase (cytochrome c-552)